MGLSRRIALGFLLTAAVMTPVFDDVCSADGLKRVYGMLDLESRTVDRWSLSGSRGNRRPYVYSQVADALANSLEEMPIEATASTIEGCAFAGAYAKAHVNVESILHPSPGTRSGEGVQIDLDVQALLFAHGTLEDRSNIKAAVMVEFERNFSDGWSFEFILGSRLTPDDWRSPGQYGLSDGTSVTLVLERFVSETSASGPERWDLVREYELGSDCGERRYGVHTPGLDKGRYRMWVEFEHTESVAPGAPVKQVEDGIHLKVYFDNII